MRISKVLLIAVFFGLSLVATLFPPFLWGEELFQEEISYERKIQLSQSGGLPAKRYAFLFGDSKQKLYSGVWLWNESEKRSKPFYIAVQRKLLVSELILEYVIALILAALLAFLVSAARWTIGALGREAPEHWRKSSQP